MFKIKAPDSTPKADGMSMMLKALLPGFDINAMMQTFNDAKQLIVAFAATIENNHAEILSRLHLQDVKLDQIHNDVKALNPDHAGDLDIPIEINGDSLSIAEAMAIKIDEQHYMQGSLEYQAFEHGLRANHAPVTDLKQEWLEYRANGRRVKRTN